MNPIVDEVKSEYGGKVRFEIVNMDVNAGKEQAIELEVLGYPNFLLLDSQGERYQLLKGVVPKAALTQALDGLLEQEKGKD